VSNIQVQYNKNGIQKQAQAFIKLSPIDKRS